MLLTGLLMDLCFGLTGLILIGYGLGLTGTCRNSLGQVEIT